MLGWYVIGIWQRNTWLANASHPLCAPSVTYGDNLENNAVLKWYPLLSQISFNICIVLGTKEHVLLINVLALKSVAGNV